MNSNNNQFRCKTHNSTLKLLACIFILLIVLLTITWAMCIGDWGNVLPLMIFALIFVTALFFVIMYYLIPMVRFFTNGYLVMDGNTVRIENKKGTYVLAERNLQDIKKIVILHTPNNYSTTKTIVLVDDIGKFGKGLSTHSGEYIKLKYSKKKLEYIQQFLPHCETETKYGKKHQPWTE